MAEVQKLMLSPTLIVGLGGTGSLGVQWAKKNIKKYLKSFGIFDSSIEIDSFQFLSIDTAYQSTFIENLDENEIFYLGNVNPLKVIKNKELIPNYAKAYQWLPRELRTGQLSTGAGGERLLGRLSLFEKQQELQKVLRQKIDMAQKGEIESLITRSYQNIELKRDVMQVHIICSLAGGTGSACLLDTAYLIRNIIGDTGVEISAHLVTYEPFTERGLLGKTGEKYAKRNFIASLAEIERFTNFKIREEDWHVFYPDGTEIVNQSAVFNNTYILGYKNMTSLSVNNLCEIIGESVALLSARPEGNSHIQALRNQQQSQGIEKDGRRQNKIYSSYKIAIASCELDEDWVRFYVKQIIVEFLRARKILPPRKYDEIREKFYFEEKKYFGAPFYFKLSDYFKENDSFHKNIENQISDIIRKKLGDDQNPSGTFSNITSKIRRRRPVRVDDRKLEDISGGKRHIDNVFQNVSLLIREFEESLLKDLDKYFYNLLITTGSIQILINALNRLLSDVVGKQLEESNYREQPYRDNVEKKNLTSKQYRDSLFPRLKKQIENSCEKIRFYLEALKAKCESAGRFLDEFGKEKINDYSVSAVIETVWIPEEVKLILMNKKDNIIKNFIEILNTYSLSSDGILDGILDGTSMGLINYLQDGLINERIINDAIHTTSEAVKDEFYNFKRSLNQVKDDHIENLYNKSKPAWVADTEGSVFENIITTNIPEGSHHYDKLRKLGNRDLSSIKKSERDFERDKHLMAFQSEHYASACQLHCFQNATRFVEYILAMDGKKLSDISEFALDRSWNIKLPVPDKDVSQLRLNFSLGILFGKIRFDAKSDSYVFNGNHSLAAKYRFQAFEKYVKDYFDKDKDILQLFDSIEGKKRQHIDKDIPAFVQTLQINVLKEIDQSLKEERKGVPPETLQRENYQLLEEKEEIEKYIYRLEDRLNQEKSKENGNIKPKS